MRVRFETVVLVVCLAITALLVSGFIETRFGNDLPHTTKYVQHVVKVGETFWAIGERYYSDKEIRPFAEFMHDMREQNGFKVGNGRKYLQPNETLIIEIKEKI